MLLVLAAFAAGMAMQEFFLFRPVLSANKLMVLSIVWQGTLAVFLALCAAKLHLSILGKLTASIVGFDNTVPEFRRIAVPVAVPVALCGGIVWLLGYGLKVLSNIATLYSPADFQWHVAISTTMATYLLLAPLALIRPAMAFGEKQPVRRGLRLAVRNMFALLLVVSLMVAPPVLFGLLAMSAQTFFGPSLALRIFTAGCFLVFSVFQFLAYEAATLIFLRNATHRAVDGFYET